MDWFLYDNGPRHERVKRVALDYFSGKNLNVYCTRFGQPSSADFELNFEKKKKKASFVVAQEFQIVSFLLIFFGTFS